MQQKSQPLTGFITFLPKTDEFGREKITDETDLPFSQKGDQLIFDENEQWPEDPLYEKSRLDNAFKKAYIKYSQE